jgi:hypothetical protein
MFEPMRKLMGRCGRSLRRAMEAERSELLRQGFGGMTRVLSRWIDTENRSSSAVTERTGVQRFGVP